MQVSRADLRTRCGEGRGKRETGTDLCPRSRVKHRKLGSVLCDGLEGWEGSPKGRGCLYTCSRSIHHTAETNTTLKSNYAPKEKIKYTYVYVHVYMHICIRMYIRAGVCSRICRENP